MGGRRSVKRDEESSPRIAWCCMSTLMDMEEFRWSWLRELAVNAGGRTATGRQGDRRRWSSMGGGGGLPGR